MMFCIFCPSLEGFYLVYRKERLWRNGKENGIQTYWEEKEEDQDECYRPEWTIEEIELEN